MKNRNMKRQQLREFNERMRLNGEKELNLKEYEEMNQFKLAYEMEIKRLRSIRIRNYILIGIGVVMIVGGVSFDGYDWLIELIKLLLL